MRFCLVWNKQTGHALLLEVDGFFEGYGRVLLLDNEGMKGLEVVE